MQLHDAQSNPLSSRSRKAAPVELMLVDGARRSLHPVAAPVSLPPSFRGVAGERLDLALERQRTVLVGCGNIADFEREERFWESAGAAAVDALRALRIEGAALVAPPVPVGLTVQQALDHFAIGATLAGYRCTAYRSKQPGAHFAVKDLQLPATLWKGSGHARQLAAAVNWARALVDAPANLMTPQAFAAAAQELAGLGVDIKVLDQKALEKLGAGGLLAVGRSSEHPPCLLLCQWNGRRAKEIDLGLVGKGLTFDAGGLNIKMPPGIAKMKFDMAGAAAVVGAMRVLAQRGAALNVAAAIPLCENVIDGTAYRPGDVITSLSGLTIEVDNTDAEGRIVLADAMTYLIRKHKPKQLIDLATLTGSMLSTLHEEFAGLFTKDDELATGLLAAGLHSGEALWRLPLSRRQDYLVESEIADVRNIGAPGFFGNAGGSAISGAKFLEKFAEETPWAHLDIAGVAWATRPITGIPKGPTGFGVRLIDAYAGVLQAAAKAG